MPYGGSVDFIGFFPPKKGAKGFTAKIQWSGAKYPIAYTEHSLKKFAQQLTTIHRDTPNPFTEFVNDILANWPTPLE